MTRQYRGVTYDVDFVPWIRIEVVADEMHAASIADAIQRAARTGRSGDGKIFLVPLAESSVAAELHVGADDRRATTSDVAIARAFTPEAMPHTSDSVSFHH